MKKLLFLVLFVISLCAVAQKNQYFLYNGKMMYGTLISQTDSVTFERKQPVDTLHLLLPRTIAKKDTVFIHDTVYVNRCGGDNENSGNEVDVDGLLPGVFSVGENKVVGFSKGNLQYRPSTKFWFFAKHQYDTIGEGNSGISPTYDGIIDLFGWGTGNNPTQTSPDTLDYPTFVDWGVNPIANGGNKPNIWRTLSYEEWRYLFVERTNAAKLFSMGSVAGVNGVIILPDGWSHDEISFTPSDECGMVLRSSAGESYYVNSGVTYPCNAYNEADWLVMEALGAVFLPAAGKREITDVTVIGKGGYYWSSEINKQARSLLFDSHILAPEKSSGRLKGYGYSVRLVQNVDKDKGVLPGEFSISEDTKAQFSKGNLQYKASTNTWRFAEKQYDFIGTPNRNISPTYNGWIDLFGWGTGDNPTNISKKDSDYLDFADWGKNAIFNGGNEPNMWRTLTGDEWGYLFCRRENAEKLWGVGCIRYEDGDSVLGLILLPDDWKQDHFDTTLFFNPVATCGFEKDKTPEDYIYDYRKSEETTPDDIFKCCGNKYTLEKWKRMETLGAVFLPYSFIRRGVSLASLCGYWSSSRNKNIIPLGAYNVSFSVGVSASWNAGYHIDPKSYTLGPSDLSYGKSVRLIRVK